MILNFGHTLGHGIEAAGGYRGLLHGEAVAIGMAFAPGSGEALGRSEPGTAARIEGLLDAFGLPVRPRRSPPPGPRGDGARTRSGAPGAALVLLRRIGEAEVRDDVPWTAARRRSRSSCSFFDRPFLSDILPGFPS